MQSLTLRALSGIAEIQPGDALEEVLIDALHRNDMELRDHDVIAICQKIISKAENRFVNLVDVTPSARALELAAQCGKDPRYVEAVLRESTAVVRCVKNVLIVRHRLGFVVANAGIDQSNIEGGDARVLLLPQDPDRSAARIRAAVQQRLGVQVAVVITDSFGRAWRVGVTGVCIGCAGLAALQDQRGRLDRHGRALRITQVAVADQLAAAATMLMGEADQGQPIVVIHGVPAEYFATPAAAASLIRSPNEDLFSS